MHGGEKPQVPTCPFCRVPCSEAEQQEGGPRIIQVQWSDKNALKWSIKIAESGGSRGYFVLFEILSNEFGYHPDKNDDVLRGLLEIAAKKGELEAIRDLGLLEEGAGHGELAVGYFKLAASSGDQVSLNKVMEAFKAMKITKEDTDKVLRAYQEYSNAVKSTDRDEARAFHYMSQSQREEHIRKFSERVRRI
ncbi:hypothetical protein ACHAWF_003490 [Thalassiosira exigua]